MDRRYYAILNLLNEFAEGHFEYDISMYMSRRWDKVDFIMRTLIVLGDDLAAQVISKDYFNRVLNAISYMAFMLNTNGSIIDLNASVGRQLGYSRDQLLGKTMRYLHASDKPFTEKWLKHVKASKNVSYLDSSFKSADERQIPVHITTVLLSERFQRRESILIIAKDNSYRRQNGKNVSM